MSRDLFAAFGDPASDRTVTRASADSAPSIANTSLISNAGLETVGEDDDFGDFEDAQTPTASHGFKSQTSPTVAGATVSHTEPQTNFPPKSEKRPRGKDVAALDSMIGKHPFAGHMDFLFDAGDDEYDAGADDLDNLASNPEAAMAYSKRIIAEQETKSAARQPDPSTLYAQQLATHTKELSHKISQSAVTQFHRILAEQQSTSKNITRPPSQTSPKQASSLKPPSARNKLQKKSGYVPTREPSILFDADNLSETDEADDDEFGDFEAGPSVPDTAVALTPMLSVKSSTGMLEFDLLGLDDVAPPELLGPVDPTKSTSIGQADSILGPAKHATSSAVITNVAVSDDDPWTDFDDEPSGAAVRQKSIVSESMIDGNWDDFQAAEQTKSLAYTSLPRPAHSAEAEETSQLPPTNIPPPALLLSIFPSIISSAQDALLAPMSKLDAKQRGQLLVHPASGQFLKSFLDSAMVLAHIIAGRKLRWKRDQILSQSMRIGPAAAGGKGGMKLVGVDKTEVAKEEREVLDAVRLWKAQVGKVRIAVSGATAAGQKLPSVPDINEQMPIRTLRAVEGGFVAPHACAICGLKREERIAKIDENVEDIFGEWWVQGTDMHVFCKSWWKENRKKLQSR